MGDGREGTDTEIPVNAALELVGRHSKLVSVETGEVTVAFGDGFDRSAHDQKHVLESECTEGPTKTVNALEVRAHPRQSSSLVSVLVV